jgi:ubiquinone/menaquinone biosynthesis C-methylase UbiE
MDDISDIKALYDRADGEENRLERHQLERDITLRFLEAYIPANAKVLEIGAATGKYTAWLAERGHAVTAVDLSEKMLEKCKERIISAGLQKNVSFYVADARDLSSLPSDTFDVVLLMGPLYHLVLQDDRHKALREAFERLQPGGLIFSAMISRYGIPGHLLNKYPDWIEKQDEVRSIITQG